VTESTDIAVIGAGIFGLATAHALCRDGAGRVTLLDRGLPASGDSGRSFSMVRRHYSNAVTARLAIAGSRTIMDWSDEVGVADAGYVRCGYLLTVPERLAEACRGNVELLQGLGLDTRFLDPDEIAAAEPELSLEGVAGAAYEPDGGFADAQKMCLGWYAAASGNGLDGRLGTDVTAIRVANGRVEGVETSAGFLATDRVVLATGAWGN
jgi:sarcosine oxidase subunit beta